MGLFHPTTQPWILKSPQLRAECPWVDLLGAQASCVPVERWTEAPHQVGTHARPCAVYLTALQTLQPEWQLDILYIKEPRLRKLHDLLKFQWCCWDLNPGQHDCMNHVLSTPVNCIMARVLASHVVHPIFSLVAVTLVSHKKHTNKLEKYVYSSLALCFV